MCPGPAALPGLLSGAAAQTVSAVERRNSVQRKGEETWYVFGDKKLVETKAFEAKKDRRT